MNFEEKKYFDFLYDLIKIIFLKKFLFVKQVILNKTVLNHTLMQKYFFLNFNLSVRDQFNKYSRIF